MAPTDREHQVGFYSDRLDNTRSRRMANIQRALEAGVRLQSVLGLTEFDPGAEPPIPIEMATKPDQQPKKPMGDKDSPSDGNANDISEAKDTDVSSPAKKVNEVDQVSDELTTAEKSGGIDDAEMLDARHPQSSATDETKAEKPKGPAAVDDSAAETANDKAADATVATPPPLLTIPERRKRSCARS